MPNMETKNYFVRHEKQATQCPHGIFVPPTREKENHKKIHKIFIYSSNYLIEECTYANEICHPSRSVRKFYSPVAACHGLKNKEEAYISITLKQATKLYRIYQIFWLNLFTYHNWKQALKCLLTDFWQGELRRAALAPQESNSKVHWPLNGIHS